ncbi:MAG TPA: DNA repair protein RadA [Patescibacteria group bacterium]
MKKTKTTTNFVCQECGYDSPSWLGKCPECGSWNSMKEFHTAKGIESRVTGSGSARQLNSIKPQTLKEIVYSERLRLQTNFNELNTVMGGGIVAGSVTLIAGDPGVGKSTLLLQLALDLANSSSSRNVLYVSGEESVEQVKMRAERIAKSLGHLPAIQSKAFQVGRAKGTEENLLLLSATDTDAIVGQIEELKPDLVIVDSIQTIESQNVSGLSGSVGQVRYSTLQFVRVAKALNVPVIIVGHVTKEGMVAGPMVLSHMVDTVLFLEGEKFAKTRILRSLKNRFGPVDEVGIFIMEEDGMLEAKNPEQLFLTTSAGIGAPTPGSVLVATLEGSRAFLVELQALTVSSRLPMPRRVVSGIDQRRLELLLAVLQKHCHLPLDTTDVFVNVAGGMRLADPAIDLGICLAVYSSLKNVALSKTVGIAEVGLLGELRMVQGLDKRQKEAEKLGFKHILTPKSAKTLMDVIRSLK